MEGRRSENEKLRAKGNPPPKKEGCLLQKWVQLIENFFFSPFLNCRRIYSGRVDFQKLSRSTFSFDEKELLFLFLIEFHYLWTIMFLESDKISMMKV